MKSIKGFFIPLYPSPLPFSLPHFRDTQVITELHSVPLPILTTTWPPSSTDLFVVDFSALNKHTAATTPKRFTKEWVLSNSQLTWLRHEGRYGLEGLQEHPEHSEEIQCRILGFEVRSPRGFI